MLINILLRPAKSSNFITDGNNYNIWDDVIARLFEEAGTGNDGDVVGQKVCGGKGKTVQPPLLRRL